jgi:hypothetical protein
MGIPTQVQAAEDAANAMLAEVNSQATAVDAQPELQGQVDTPEPQPEYQAPAPQPQQPDQAEARYRSLQGILNKEVNSLQGQVKTLTGQLELVLGKLDQQQRQLPAPETGTPVAAEPKDIEDFGSDLVGMVNRVATAQIARLTQALDGKLAVFSQQMATLHEQLSGTTKHVAVNAEQMFVERLGKLVPEWEAINVDQRFLAWLAEVDPVYGVPRQSALENAAKSLNAERVAAVFNAFTGPRQVTPKVDPLDKQVSPKGSAAPAPQSQQPRMYKSSDVTKFYDDVRRGHYRGKDAEMAKLEAEFNNALAEGRIM